MNTPNALLRQARLKRGWTQHRLAKEIGVDLQTIRSWERGRRVPLLATRRRLAELFELPPEELGFLADPPPLLSFQVHDQVAEKSVSSSKSDTGWREVLQRVYALYQTTAIAYEWCEQSDTLATQGCASLQDAPLQNAPAGTRIAQVYAGVKADAIASRWKTGRPEKTHSKNRFQKTPMSKTSVKTGRSK